ncbi:hypothetical protein [Xenophilus sp. Marseille-Q4582]|uniref:portal protein n=1 Tax=Xenophilus sp. Marseille-Q4582 TaxID=2866600 RepID=UPI001CE44B35|nr:hypothetical protein [Xenophilus sp. Marseille-Q4582]
MFDDGHTTIAPPKDRPKQQDIHDPAALANDPTVMQVHGPSAKDASAEEAKMHRHHVLMDLLDYEAERQAEERMQAQIDEDYYDHLQWRPEDAQELIRRGQAPLVFNQSRQTIDWLSGTEKRMRKDFKILPREPGDEAGAELKTKLVKYTDDANLTQWHRSRAFKQAATAGLSWLEEGVNPDPEAEIVYSGWEDWRNVYRDSHSRNIDMNVDARYLFRARVLDLDYAKALLPGNDEHLNAVAGRMDEDAEGDDIWYMGQKLTGASETEWGGLTSLSSMSERAAYMGRNGYYDFSRRRSVRLIECWYRVPERVKVFAGGPFQGRIVNPMVTGHQQALNDHQPVYEAVKMRMRVMIATKYAALRDQPSPFRHGRFLLVPLYGYRRARDGAAYGVMRGMRDIQDDLNKRRSKALFALSSNRVKAEEGAFEDPEEARDEAARPDMLLMYKRGHKVEFEKPVGDYQGNLELAAQNVQQLREVGGVTGENLGYDTRAQSGKAIIAKQDQGSLTTGELFDNLLLAIRQTGRLRLSHIEQFWTEEKAIRIAGENKPIEWLEINKFDPATGQILNDITAREADFIVDTQDYRSTLAQAALEQMFALLGQIATFAPQVVLAVLDLVVDSAEIKNKEEWVSRIRKLNGQRDPTKPPTPEELQAEQEAAAKQAEAEQLQVDTAKAQLAQIQTNIDLMRQQMGKLDAEEVLKRVEVMFQSLQTAQAAATTPGLTPAADEISKSAGGVDKNPGGMPPMPPAAPAAEVPPEAPPDAEPALPAEPIPPADPAIPQ